MIEVVKKYMLNKEVMKSMILYIKIELMTKN